MGELTTSAITSLDGYIADAEGNFDWSAPDEEVHSFVNNLERELDPEAVRRVKRGARARHLNRLSELAAEAIKAGCSPDCYVTLQCRLTVEW